MSNRIRMTFMSHGAAMMFSPSFSVSSRAGDPRASAMNKSAGKPARSLITNPYMSYQDLVCVGRVGESSQVDSVI